MALSIIDELNQAGAIAQALGNCLQLLERLVTVVARLLPQRSPSTSYENLSLSIHLDIRDARGRRAVLSRVHRVRFLTGESGVIRDVVWGDGDTLRGYEVKGATVVGIRREGIKQIVLLALPVRPAPGEVVTVQSKRVIIGGWGRREEYLETEVESAAKSVTLAVAFPVTRPPREVVAETSPPIGIAHGKSARLRRDGRASVRWHIRPVRLLVSYRLRWTW